MSDQTPGSQDVITEMSPDTEHIDQQPSVLWRKALNSQIGSAQCQCPVGVSLASARVEWIFTDKIQIEGEAYT